MAQDTAPSNLTLTPYATVTVGAGTTTDQSSEFWQLVAGNTFKVWEGVPYSLMQNLIQGGFTNGGGALDSAITQQLAGYPSRVVTQL